MVVEGWKERGEVIVVGRGWEVEVGVEGGKEVEGEGTGRGVVWGGWVEWLEEEEGW